jgi:broad specificity phosphatase PhoE
LTELLLCRHGRTEWNVLGRYQGQTDVPLNAEGREQARLLALELRDLPIDAVYASDLSRSVDTATAIADLHGLTVVQDARLREINLGRWEGQTVAEIRRGDAALLDLWQAAPREVTLPGGESLEDVRERAIALVQEIVALYPRGLVCIVSHKVVQTIIRCELTGEDLDAALRLLPANASFEQVPVPDGLCADATPDPTRRTRRG